MRVDNREDGQRTAVSASIRLSAVALLCGLWLCLGSAVTRAEPPASPQEPLPVHDPVEFLEKCLDHFDQMHIRGSRLTLHKRERIGGTLEPVEEIEISVRMHPRSIFMRWLSGARRADRALYVAGENNGQILVHPTGFIGRLFKTAALDPNSSAVRNASRYTIQEVGLRHTLQRTLDAWRLGDSNEVGEIVYLGVRTVHAAGDRTCYKLRRTTPEPENGITETTIYIDKENLFQVGTVLKGPGGSLLGCYFYHDIELNPDFAPGQFQPGALLK